MAGAGLVVESSKGERNLGQHEINFRYADALTAADEHMIFKNAAKEIAAQEDMSITFMAKRKEREGSSCHVHLSLAGAGGESVFARDQAVFEQFLAGQLACLRDLTLMFAPNVNSYKRFQAATFAPTAPRIPRRPRAGPCTCPSAASPRRARSPAPPCSCQRRVNVR